MAPPWVLLDRCVDFCFDAEDDDSAAAVVAAAKNKVSVAKASVLQALTESTVALLGSMKPDAVLPHPPGISTLRLLGSKSHRAVPSSSLVACADKGLLVLYAGMYCGPGSPTRGCYLVYDASAGAPVLLTTVPPPPVARYLTCIGSGAVVLRRHTPSSAYLLAELATTRERGLPDAVLYLWRSDSPTPQWVKKEVQLPPEVRRAPGNHNFCADLSFSALDSLCWVDLLRGIVVCHDPWGPQDPVFSFIPLPDGCPSVGTSDHPYRPRMLEFRSAACVGGAIKVVTMEGYLEDLYFHQFRLTTWTLSPDVREWRQDGVFPLKNLWMTDEYRALKLPQHTPVCPVLSAREEAVVYVVVNDVEHVELREMVQGSQAVRTQIDFKGQYVLGLDTHHNKIISTSHGLPASMMQLTPRLIATEFCASLQGIKDRQREVEAREDGESGKKPRVD